METLPIHRSSLPDLVATYQRAQEDIQAAYAMLARAQESLTAAFDPTGYGFRLADSHRHATIDYADPKPILAGGNRLRGAQAA